MFGARYLHESPRTAAETGARIPRSPRSQRLDEDVTERAGARVSNRFADSCGGLRPPGPRALPGDAAGLPELSCGSELACRLAGRTPNLSSGHTAGRPAMPAALCPASPPSRPLRAGPGVPPWQPPSVPNGHRNDATQPTAGWVPGAVQAESTRGCARTGRFLQPHTSVVLT